MQCEVVKVKDGSGSYYVINKDDFDSEKHELFEDEPKKAGRPKK